jgi:two-component system phosphate regulon response regulator PhoB
MARILVADDAALLRVLVCRSLGSHRTIEAEDGHEALALTVEHRPDIVILDWMMPGLNGLEVSQAIREDPDLAGIQIVMMTARTGFDSEDQARAAGADHFINKPIMPRQVANLVERILAAKRASRHIGG